MPEPEPRTPLGCGYFESRRGGVPHVADGQTGLLGRVDAVEEDAVQSHVERLLDDPAGFIGFGRKARHQGDVRLEVALLQHHGAIGHREMELVQRGHVQRVVLHVDVDVVGGRPSGGTCRPDRHLDAGLETVDRAAFGELRDNGIEMQPLLGNLRRNGVPAAAEQTTAVTQPGRQAFRST